MSSVRRLAPPVLIVATAALTVVGWRWRSQQQETAATPSTAAATVSRSLSGPGNGSATSSASNGLAPPRLRVAGAVGTSTAAMSEGLRQDLAMFDDTQLRSELESIAVSHPAVSILQTVCEQLPCRAEVGSADADDLNTFVANVSQRFQGHVTVEFRPRPPTHAPPSIIATLCRGTRGR